MHHHYHHHHNLLRLGGAPKDPRLGVRYVDVDCEGQTYASELVSVGDYRGQSQVIRPTHPITISAPSASVSLHHLHRRQGPLVGR